VTRLGPLAGQELNVADVGPGTSETRRLHLAREKLWNVRGRPQVCGGGVFD